jgi:hypothetical protein
MEKQAEQAVEPTASVEDRIGDKFDRAFFGTDEPESEQPEQQAKPESQDEGETPEVEADEAKPADEGSEEGVEVEFNGTKYQVPPELKDALMATQDYTKKTTEVAQLRKNAEIQLKEAALYQEQRQFQESVAGDLDQLKMLSSYIDHVNKTTDWQKLETTEAFRVKMQLDQLKDQRSELEKALEGKYAQFKAKSEESRSKLRQEMGEALSKVIPQWNEETQKVLKKYAQDMGYPADALENMSLLDHQLVWKASQYDKIKSEAKAVVSKASTPVIKPTARQEMPKAVQDKLNYRKAIKKASNPKVREKLATDRIAEIFGG